MNFNVKSGTSGQQPDIETENPTKALSSTGHGGSWPRDKNRLSAAG